MRITNTDGAQITFTIKSLGNFVLNPGEFVDLDDKFIDIAAVELRFFDELSLSAAVGGAPISHASLADLIAPADDHSQYFHIDGRRALTADLDAGGNQLTNLGPPIAGTDAVNRDFVAALLSAFIWQDAVLDRDLVTAPAATAGDRYIIAGTGGLWSPGTINDIAEFDGSVWSFETPTEGFTAYVDDENIYAHFNGTVWVKIGNVIDHSVLLNLNVGDPHTQYLLADGSRALGGNLDLGGNNIVNVVLVDGVDVSSHGSRHNPGGADAVTTAAATTISGSTTNTEGTATSLARSNHTHNILTGNVVAVGSANSEGTSANLARADHVHSHGNQGGGALHAVVVAAGAAGFMSGADKTKLNAYPATPAEISVFLLLDGTRAMTGNFNMGTNDITNVGLVDGIDVTSHGSRHNPDGADAVSTGTPIATAPNNVLGAGTANSLSRSDHSHSLPTAAPSSTGTANAAGTANSVSRSDHVHDTVISNTQVTATANFASSLLAFTVITGMTITPGAGTYLVTYSASHDQSVNSGAHDVAIFANGVQVTHTLRHRINISSSWPGAMTAMDSQAVITVAASQAIDVRMSVISGTGDVDERSLILIRLGP